MSQTKLLNVSGIPTIVHPPADLNKPAPLIILWHGFGTPSSEEMLAQTLPLKEVQAWKAYPELPLFGRFNESWQSRRTNAATARRLYFTTVATYD